MATKRKSRIFKFKGLDGIDYKLTAKQKRFSDYFLTFEGNGTDAIIEAGYNCFYPKSGAPNRKLAGVMASENLVKPSISAYIAKKFEDTGLNDATIDKHWLFNITQFADLPVKNKAIDMYNKKKGRYAPEEHKHRVETIEITKYDDKD